MRSNTPYLLIWFLLHIYFISFSQEYYVNTREIGMEEGLSHYKIFSLYPEKAGMWIGTADGLNFYDGYHWKSWTKGEGQLSHKAVNFILKDQDDFFWLFQTKKPDVRGDIQSINLLTPNRDSTISFQQKFGDQIPFDIQDIQYFFEDHLQRLYFSVNGQLWRYTPSTFFELMSIPEGFQMHSVFSDGTYVGKLRDKLVLISANGELLYTSDYSLNDNFYQVIGNRKQFWVWQYRSHCQVYEQTSNTHYKSTPFAIQPQDQIFRLLCFDEQENHVWITKGLHSYLYNNNGQLLYQHELSPRRACLDSKNNLWAGKHGLSILHIRKKKFKSYLHQERNKVSFDDFYRCRGIIEKDQKLYVNTYRGLRIIDLKNDEIVSSPIASERNFGILKDRKDQIWAAYKYLFQLDHSASRILNTFKFQENPPRIWSLFEDRNNRIWMGHTGLSYLEDGKIKAFEKYNAFSELAEAVILFFYKDKNGVIWVGSNNGLYQLDLDKGIIGAYGKKRKEGFYLPSNKFQHMYQDGQGIFWLATEDAGVLKWNKSTGDIQKFDKSHGMPSNNIYSVYEDDYNRLWLSSFNGLICFNKKSLRITIYNEEEGISNDEFNRISHYQTEDGHIYFGGQNGVTRVDPKNFLEEKTGVNTFELNVKQVSIFGFNTWKDTISDGFNLDLPPGVRVIDFEIMGSDIFWTNKIDLHYTLSPLTNSHPKLPVYKEKISFDNHVELFGMHPGDYDLQIKAIHKNGKQLGESINIKLRIAKPIYHTASFWGFVILGIGLCIWGFIKFRMARIQRRQKELEILVTKRTEEVLKNSITIQTQAEQIETMKNQLNRKDELWLEQFRNTIQERLEDPNLYLPSIIDDLDISRTLFYEKVKTLTQMTPNQYIQELRLTKAKAILDEGNVKTVKEVAYAIGMKRPSYFSKLFKERFGILPSAYFRDSSN